jgi:8-oxo-dGTP pyrophosphatase MutT (NUDIX family)
MIQMVRRVLVTLFQIEKTLTQVAALPYVERRKGMEILLITSRRRKRWILPRGWPIDGESYAIAAAREAEEEAGAVGMIGETAIGDYVYDKRTGDGYRVPCRVFVYPLLVSHQMLQWREKAERDTRWCDLETAVSLVRHEGLSAFLLNLARSPDTRATIRSTIENNIMKAN